MTGLEICLAVWVVGFGWIAIRNHQVVNHLIRWSKEDAKTIANLRASIVHAHEVATHQEDSEHKETENDYKDS